MWFKAFGVALIALGVWLAMFFSGATADVDGQAHFLAELGQAFDQKVDPQHWAIRWRATAAVFGIVAVGATVSGASFLISPKVGWLALGSTLFAASGWIVAQRLQGAAVYAFEPGWVQVLTHLALAVVCLQASRSRRWT